MSSEQKETLLQTFLWPGIVERWATAKGTFNVLNTNDSLANFHNPVIQLKFASTTYNCIDECKPSMYRSFFNPPRGTIMFQGAIAS